MTIIYYTKLVKQETAVDINLISGIILIIIVEIGLNMENRIKIGKLKFPGIKIKSSQLHKARDISQINLKNLTFFTTMILKQEK